MSVMVESSLLDKAYAKPLPKSLFGYRVVDTLGEGAASVIYRVTDPATHQQYALKHVIRKTDKDARFIDQLEAEFEVASKVRHPALRRCYDLKFNKTMLWRVTDAALVMELVEGEPLEFRLPDSLGGIVDVFITTAAALDSLHTMGFVHCDLKPNNILVGPRGEVKVIDLGQAVKVGTKKTRIQGTPDYIAPEQVKLAAVTIRTDVYNFGATMYRMFTGRYANAEAPNTAVGDLRNIVPPIEVNARIPGTLNETIMACLQWLPERRPAGMSEVEDQLKAVARSMKLKLKDLGRDMDDE